MLNEGRKVDGADIDRSDSSLLKPVKLRWSFQTMTRSMIDQTLDRNDVNTLSLNNQKKKTTVIEIVLTILVPIKK